MRIAVISDIHANLHALEAVLAAIEAEAIEEIWCLGDTIGYGPRPNECVALVRDRASLCLAGNHDLVVLDKIDIAWFAGDAAAAAEWTRTVLDEESRTFLDALEPAAERPGVELFHGSPRDPVWDYVLGDEAASSSFLATSAPLLLVGHSHVQLRIELGERGLEGGLAPGGTEVSLGSGRQLLNPGSVGQPRDGDPRAAWLVIDAASGRATFRRTDYPVQRTQAEMRECGLPRPLSERLAHGA